MLHFKHMNVLWVISNLQYKSKAQQFTETTNSKVLDINPIVLRPAKTPWRPKIHGVLAGLSTIGLFSPHLFGFIKKIIRNGNTLACGKPVSIVLYLELSCGLKVHLTPKEAIVINKQTIILELDL